MIAPHPPADVPGRNTAWQSGWPLTRRHLFAPALLGLALAGLVGPPASAEIASLASLTVEKGTLASGDAGSLSADDDVLLQITSALPAGKKGKKKHGIDWFASTTVSDDTVALRITFAGSASSRVKQTVYLWRWKNRKWKPVQNRHVGPDGILRTSTVDSAFHFVSSTGEVRIRVAAEAKSAFEHGTDLLQIEVLPAGIPEVEDKAAPAAASPGSFLEVEGGPVPRQGIVRFATRNETSPGLVVFDARGREVVRLRPVGADGPQRSYIWRGEDASGRGVARGVYFVRARLDTGARTQRLVWLRD